MLNIYVCRRQFVSSTDPCCFFTSLFVDFCWFSVVSVIGLLSIVGFVCSWAPRPLFLAESRFFARETREKLLLN